MLFEHLFRAVWERGQLVVNLGSFTICFDNMDSINPSGHVGAKMNQPGRACVMQNLEGVYITCES